MTSDDDRDVLAAEYVLGTLDAAERAQAEALVRADASFAMLVRGWERQLNELHAGVEPVEPPPQLFERIRQRLAGAQPGGAQVIELGEMRRRVARWRSFGTAMAALAAVLVALLVTSVMRPNLVPSRLRPAAEVAQAPAAGRLVAVLQQDAASPAFILTVDVDKRTMTVRRVAAQQPTGKSYELWLVSKQFPKPRSLGLVGQQEFTTGTALAAYQPETISDATYAVSLEPEGGSPTGEPTGAVLWGGKLIQAVPAARP
jgi:anti-sigma-K factor RskA